MKLRRIRSRRWHRPLVVLLFLLGVGVPANSQVNTESLRRDAIEPGIQMQLGAESAYRDGNSSLFTLIGNARMDYLDDQFYSFVVGRYERGTSKGEEFLNDGFVHVRAVYSFDSTFMIEGFAQKEFNDFILLRDRYLFGGGGRFGLLRTSDSNGSINIFLGIGGMYEHELTTDSMNLVTDLFRSTNYLSFSFKVNRVTDIGVVGYFQPAVADFHDFRILSDAHLRVALSDMLFFSTTLRYRFDNEPPLSLERYDIGLTNGLTIRF